ncbi:WD40 repeat-like protein [Schizophyllum commune H4-8]|uniref:WD40 repeat-like protein n=1 Tax=Schizophyllum commune (strain H4-8 / FGSC 9210) TaxID=578458 RepID=UPI00215FF74B|nr:WD40 repeat-like protein [Schizophyllum commune H4-8]XP_050198658.1 WD40 repeat-like protein [Schizophyllum commune H4-8]KAI5887352.1 WD40 repeat-like protein [Schizophyllum commune H4-8]KAI5888895.1 WD40 repeat-like protein [Schizophyllum commune H4-8]
MARPSSEYTYWTTIPDQKDGITSLSFSPRGKYLAITGYDGVSVWNVGGQDKVTVPDSRAEYREKHLYTRSAWLFFVENSVEILVLCSKLGDVLLWTFDETKQARACSSFCHIGATEVVSLDVYHAEVPADESALIAAALTNGTIVVSTVTVNAVVLERFIITLDQGRFPQRVKFDQLGHTLVVFDRAGGIMQVSRYDCESGMKVGVREDAPRLIASVAFDPVAQRYAAYTGRSIEIVSMSSDVPPVSIPCANSILYPMHLAFGEGSEVLLAGTDNGHAVLYDVNNPSTVQVLDYPKGGLVQPVATCTTAEGHILAFAGSSILKATDIIIYRKRAPLPGSRMSRRCIACCKVFLPYCIYWACMLGIYMYGYYAHNDEGGGQ